MKKMILDLFAGGHSVTVYTDAGFTSATASATTDVAKDTEVTITPVLKTGYELDEYEVVAGGVTIEVGDESVGGFDMGEEDVVVYAKSKSNNKYKVTEECMVNVNDNKQVLHKNTILTLTPNGVPYDVAVESGGASVTMNDAVQSLIDQGILVKI